MGKVIRTLPKVIKKKKVEVAPEEKSNVEVKEKESPKVERVLKEEKKAMRPCGCCPAGPNPVAEPGQRYFEAPDGHLILGESDKQQTWDRRLNGGKGAWINPAR